MVQISLVYTGIVLVVMGIVCVRFLRDRHDNPSESFLRSYVLLFGLLLLGLGFSMAAMAGRYRGYELYAAVLAVMTAGAFMVVYPAMFRSLLAWIVKNLSPSGARALALFNALLCFICGSMMIYIAAVRGF